ncbi:DUF4399 domain-containing protein [Aestuariivita boseongensis]|uniref:DUF4399 domain-containing protein n=1 Tax=Aestuariivita boseongensis TaxID=1470562 RepID=UPI0006801E7A|nr:DUF4399 domain-containing protein [Aestuariivita boseongensis]
MKHLLLAAATSLILAGPALAEDPVAYVVNIEDGANVTSPVTVVFGLRGKGVAPAGVEKDGTGHHHILLNRAPFGEGPEDAEMSEFGIPADDNHIHFGGGQTEATLELEPGQHSIQLVLGDHNHKPHDPPVVSKVVTFTVTD